MDHLYRDAHIRTERLRAQDTGSYWEDDSWDWTAIGSLLTLTTLALAAREDRDVEQVPLCEMAWHLTTPGRVRELVTSTLPEQTTDDATGPVADAWRWVTRTWPQPKQPSPGGRGVWGGLPRGIARGLPDPAIDICTSWACNVVLRAMMRANGSIWPPGTDVAVTGGRFTGETGQIIAPYWNSDDTAQRLIEEPIPGYQVRLPAHSGEQMEEHIDELGAAMIATGDLRAAQAT